MPVKLITVTGYKGGVGKSTTAIHLAAFLARHGKTILVDSDPNSTCINWAERGHLPFEVVSFQEGLTAMEGKEFAVFDTPARPDSEDLAKMAKGCKLLILPTCPDIMSVEPMLEMARDLGKRTNYRALVTNVPPPPNRQGESVRESLLSNGLPVFETIIRRTVGYHRAAFERVIISDVSDSRLRAGWQDYVNLGEEVLKLL